MSNTCQDITQPNTPLDDHDQPIAVGNVYRVYPPKGKPIRVLVIEDPATCDVYLAPCNERGKRIADARLVRLDETATDLTWEHTPLEWE